MILITDTWYSPDDTWCRVAGITLDRVDARQVWQEHAVTLSDVHRYEPGSLYKREMPGILALIDTLPKRPDIVIIDGYCSLGDQDGMGNRLYKTSGIPVIGVAKTPFQGGAPYHWDRPTGKPLYVSSAGISLCEALALLNQLESPHRIPVMIQRADQWSRGVDRQGRHLAIGLKDLKPVP